MDVQFIIFFVTQKLIHLIMFVYKHCTEGTFNLKHRQSWYASEGYNGKQDKRKCRQRGILTGRFCDLLQSLQRLN